MTSLQGIQRLGFVAAKDSTRADLVYDRQIMWLRYLGVARIGVLSFLAVGAAFLDLERGQTVLLSCYVGGFIVSEALFHPPLAFQLIFWVAFNILFVVFFYRHARGIWIAFVYLSGHVYADPDVNNNPSNKT